MYLPSHFELKDKEEIFKIVSDFPLAIIIANGINGITANHIPLLPVIENNELKGLQGHIAKNNPLCQDIENSAQVLVIFRSEDSYISPNWYPSKRETHQQVPTWNYQAVHIKGNIEFIEDKKFILGVVGKLTKIHENKIGEEVPWKISQAPKEYIDKMLEAIIGIKISVSEIIAKSKLSQNKEPRDYEALKQELIKKGKNNIAGSM